MAVILPFHAPISTSRGYKSGRSSCRDTPVIRSTASTRSGGTSSHCEIAWIEMPSGPAKAVNPPTVSIARFKASRGVFMVPKSSLTLLKSQASLGCGPQAVLYAIDMTLGKRIKLARERLVPKPTQKDIATRLGISDKAVSSWERDETLPEHDKMPELRRLLKVTYAWLYEGTGDPPAPDDLEVTLDGLAPAERAAVMGVIESFHRQHTRVA